MNNYCLTIDIDWAPDFVIESITEELLKSRIKCTWFITHNSPYIKKLYEHSDIFEFGIHPNFMKGSTHGNTEEEVLKHIRSIVPESSAVRTHFLYQSSSLLSTMVNEFGIEIDCSLLLYLTPGIVPHKIYFKHNSKPLYRLPFFWEDDICLYNPDRSHDINSPVYHCDGLKIFNFHPMLVYLNCENMQSYEKLKLVKPLLQVKHGDADSFINKKNNSGTGVFFRSFIDYISKNKIQTYKLSEIKNEYERQIKK